MVLRMELSERSYDILVERGAWAGWDSIPI